MPFCHGTLSICSRKVHPRGCDTGSVPTVGFSIAWQDFVPIPSPSQLSDCSIHFPLFSYLHGTSTTFLYPQLNNDFAFLFYLENRITQNIHFLSYHHQMQVLMCASGLLHSSFIPVSYFNGWVVCLCSEPINPFVHWLSCPLTYKDFFFYHSFSFSALSIRIQTCCNISNLDRKTMLPSPHASI